MKSYFLQIILILSFFILTDCDPDKNPVAGEPSQYAGTWRWIKTVGGIFPRVITPEEGSSLKLYFSDGHTFKIFRNDSMKVVAHYKIESEDSAWDKISYSQIETYDFHFSGDTEYAYIYSDTLQIWDGMDDGFYGFFVKEE